MSEGKATAIVPVEQRTIDFYGDTLVAVRDEQGIVWVPVRPIAQRLGVDWASQYQRIKRDPVLSEAIRPVVVKTTEAGKRDAICLPLDMLHGWLFGISAARVSLELRETIVRYQRECYRVLYRAFAQHEAPADFDEATALQIAEMAETIKQTALGLAKLARRLHATEQFVESLMGGSATMIR